MPWVLADFTAKKLPRALRGGSGAASGAAAARSDSIALMANAAAAVCASSRTGGVSVGSVGGGAAMANGRNAVEAASAVGLSLRRVATAAAPADEPSTPQTMLAVDNVVGARAPLPPRVGFHGSGLQTAPSPPRGVASLAAPQPFRPPFAHYDYGRHVAQPVSSSSLSSSASASAASSSSSSAAASGGGGGSFDDDRLVNRKLRDLARPVGVLGPRTRVAEVGGR